MNISQLRFGGYQNQQSIHNQAADYFGKLLQEQLGSHLSFELLGNVLNLGRQSNDLPKMVMSRELDFCYISTVFFTKEIPSMSILDLPFLIKDRGQFQRAVQGAFGSYLANQFSQNTPFKLLGIWDNGFRHITNKIRPIRTPEDCKGLTVRTQISEVHVASLKAMGFIPIPVDVKVFVDEIDGPRFDGQDNPLTNSYNFGVHNYHRHFTLTGHFFGGTAFICRQEMFDRLSLQTQQIFLTAAQAATVYQWQLAALEDEHILAQIDPDKNEVITLTEEQKDTFRQLVKPVIETYQHVIPKTVFDMLNV
jgi:TRAP-type C4-dicarboxylate transport system substrate-binding protein